MSERIAQQEAERNDRLQDFVQRVMQNDSSESDQDLPPVIETCTREGCNCILHSNNSIFNKSDDSFEATPDELSDASKSWATSDSGNH